MPRSSFTGLLAASKNMEHPYEGDLSRSPYVQLAPLGEVLPNAPSANDNDEYVKHTPHDRSGELCT